MPAPCRIRRTATAGDAQVLLHFHVVGLAVFGFFQLAADLGDGGNVLQHFVGFIRQAGGTQRQAEAGEEALAPLAQGGGALQQWLVIVGQHQHHGHLALAEVLLDHTQQAAQGRAQALARLATEQLTGGLQPFALIEAGPGADATEQVAVQFSRRDGQGSFGEQGGEGGIGGAGSGHDRTRMTARRHQAPRIEYGPLS